MMKSNNDDDNDIEYDDETNEILYYIGEMEKNLKMMKIIHLMN